MLQDVAMEPQPGSPTSPPFSPVTASFDSATATTPSEEMLAPDEPQEEEVVTELEPGRKSTSSSSSSSSASSAESLCDIDVVELGDPSVAAVPPEGENGKATPVQSAEVKLDERAAPEDDRAAPVVHSAEVRPDDEQAAAPGVVHSAEVKPDDWATWPEPPPPAVDDSFSSTESAAEAPQVQTVSPALEGAGAAGNEFDPQRIPASVFQPRTSVSQAEWSMASNESLFSIQGACEVGGPYGSSRSHFDFFYDEAMAAAAAGAEADSKLPTVTEGTESESKEFAVPGSATSADCAGSANDPKAAVFRRHESGSGGSSSNFSFAFPILAETSPKKKDVLASTALYQPLEKEIDLPPPLLEPPVSAFMEMTTEEERRSSANTGCCCCGCCWFDCSCCCRWQWWRCGCCRCSCSCPTFCRCSWCLCF